MPFTMIRQDITRMKVDAIVNAANRELRMGGGVCGAIFKAAGPELLQQACSQIGMIHTGEAVITPGFALPARYVIHAVGPVYDESRPEKSRKLLRVAYSNALQTAYDNQCESIAFPLISSGIYGYPKEEAFHVAIGAIQDFLVSHDMDVYLTIFGRASYMIGDELYGNIQSYIDEHYVEQHEVRRRKFLPIELQDLEAVQKTRESMSSMPSVEMQNLPAMEGALGDTEDEIPEMAPASLEELVGNLDEPFNITLLRLIDARGMTDTEVYKRANIDRKLFSKIRTGKGYMPGKRTILALSIAMELTLSETDDLLERAGYALSHSQKFDVIVEYFIVNGKYDIFEINNVLFRYDQPLLGSN